MYVQLVNNFIFLRETIYHVLSIPTAFFFGGGEGE